MKKGFMLLILLCFVLILCGCSGSKNSFDEANFQDDLSYVKQFYYYHSEAFNQVAACFWEDENIVCVTPSSSYATDENGEVYYTDIAIKDTTKRWVDNPQETFPSLYAAAKAIITCTGLTNGSTFYYMQRNNSDIIQYTGHVGRYENEHFTELCLVFSKHEFTQEDLPEGWLRYSEKLDENCWLAAVDTSLPG